MSEFAASVEVKLNILGGLNRDRVTITLSKFNRTTELAVRFLRGLRWVRLQHHSEWSSVTLTTTHKGRIGLPYLRRSLERELKALSAEQLISLYKKQQGE